MTTTDIIYNTIKELAIDMGKDELDVSWSSVSIRLAEKLIKLQ
jgi:uncharacterized protein (DUF305 family)